MNIITIILISILGLLALVFLYDISQKHDTIWRNFPVAGHFRNISISIGAAIRQYWVASDKEEMPFNREDSDWIYNTSKKQNNNFGFGTTELLYQTGYPIIKHAVFPLSDNDNNGKFSITPPVLLDSNLNVIQHISQSITSGSETFYSYINNMF